MREGGPRQGDEPGEEPGSGNPLWDEAPALRDLTPRQKAGAVVVRDLVVFQLKLVLDGLMDLVMIWVSIGAATLDLVAPSGPKGRRFYASMRVAERFDTWLNLYGASRAAPDDPADLLGAGRTGADSLLGHLEKKVLGHEDPRPDRPVRPPGDRRR